MGKLRRIRAMLKDDAQGAKVYVASLKEAFRLSRHKKALGVKLLVSYRDIGSKSSGTEEAQERRSFGSVKESEAVLAKRDAALVLARQNDEEAEKLLADRKEARRTEIDRLQALVSRHKSLHTEALRVLTQYEKEAGGLRKRLAKPTEPKPGEIPHSEIGARLIEMDEVLPGAREAEETVRSDLQAAEGDLERERAEWSEEEEKLQDAQRVAKRAVEVALAEHAEAEAAHQGKLGDLGKSVARADFSAPEVKDSVDAAKTLLKEIEECDTKIGALRTEAAVAKSGARRFTLLLGGALLILIALIVVVVLLVT